MVAGIDDRASVREVHDRLRVYVNRGRIRNSGSRRRVPGRAYQVQVIEVAFRESDGLYGLADFGQIAFADSYSYDKILLRPHEEGAVAHDRQDSSDGPVSAKF